MTEENGDEKLNSLEISAFMGFNAMEGMKYALPIIVMISLSATFIERVTLVMFRIGGK